MKSHTYSAGKNCRKNERCSFRLIDSSKVCLFFSHVFLFIQCSFPKTEFHEIRTSKKMGQHKKIEGQFSVWSLLPLFSLFLYNVIQQFLEMFTQAGWLAGWLADNKTKNFFSKTKQVFERLGSKWRHRKFGGKMSRCNSFYYLDFLTKQAGKVKNLDQKEMQISMLGSNQRWANLLYINIKSTQIFQISSSLFDSPLLNRSRESLNRS